MIGCDLPGSAAVPAAARTAFVKGDRVTVAQSKRSKPRLFATVTRVLTSHAWVEFDADQVAVSGTEKKILLASLRFVDPPVAALGTLASADAVVEPAVASSSPGGIDVDEPAPSAASIDASMSVGALGRPTSGLTVASTDGLMNIWADVASVFGGNAD